MGKVYLFAIVLLVASLTGCIEIEEETVDPVGEDGMSSLEKKVSNLEAKIAEYETPKVNFMEMSGYTYVTSSSGSVTNEFNISDDGYLLCSYIEFYDRTICNLYAQFYDSNGLITSYSWEASETSVNQSHLSSGLCQIDAEPIICLAAVGSSSTASTDVCKFGEVNQRLTFTVYDNDGNSASASYDLDYDAVCTSTG
jgi:hypothetical protein